MLSASSPQPWDLSGREASAHLKYPSLCATSLNTLLRRRLSLSLSTTTISFLLLICVMFNMASYGAKGVFKSDSIRNLPLITDMTIDDIAAGLDAETFTSAQLVQVFLTGIDEVDGTFHSVLEINPDALHIAKELDDERRIN